MAGKTTKASDIELVPAEQEPSASEEAEAQADASATAAQPKSGQIKVFSPQFEQFVYGPNSEIKFGQRGGFEPHVWVGEESELVSQMLAKYPAFVVVNDKPQAFMCASCNPPRAFQTLQGWQNHQKMHKGQSGPR